MKILWDLEIASAFPRVSLSIIATEIDKVMLARAQEGCFEATSLHELPARFVDQAFDQIGSQFCIKAPHRQRIEFLYQDLRAEMPPSVFDLILCRYLAFTYFAAPLQRRILDRIVDRLSPDGYIVIGSHEKLPNAGAALLPLPGAPQIFTNLVAYRL